MTTALRVYANNVVLGNVIARPDGYVFNPKLPHRRVSTKRWPTPEAAIPAWAKQMATRIEVVEPAEPTHGQ